MFHQTEAKAQGWRAVAIFDDRNDCLIYLGRSSTQVRTGYVQAFLEILDEEERDHVRTIAMQRWQGAPDEGRWMHHTNLSVPNRVRLAHCA